MKRKRDRGLLVRFTDAELSAIRGAARRAKRTIAAMVREAIAREVTRCRGKRTLRPRKS
jgi:hypothetical protein